MYTTNIVCITLVGLHLIAYICKWHIKMIFVGAPIRFALISTYSVQFIGFLCVKNWKMYIILAAMYMC